MVVDKNSDVNSIGFLNKCYNLAVSDENATEFLNNSTIAEEKITSAVEKYLIITDSDQREEITGSFTEFVESNSIETEKIDTLDSIAKVAFQRLTKHCKECYMEKISNPDSVNFEDIKNLIARVKRDYELIMSLY